MPTACICGGTIEILILVVTGLTGLVGFLGGYLQKGKCKCHTKKCKTK